MRKGFTLIEMVVAMGIFMIFLTAVLGAYIGLTDTQKKANLNREAVSEARELLTYISEETKDKAIDYSCYESVSGECREGFISLNEVNEIGLISKDGLERTIIRKYLNEDEKLEIEVTSQSRDNTQREWNTPGQPTPLHSENLKIQSAAFLITPNKDPFKNDLETANSDSILYQPTLHVILNIERKNSDNPIILETSISSRIYTSL